jgi:hypothetical protein
MRPAIAQVSLRWVDTAKSALMLSLCPFTARIGIFIAEMYIKEQFFLLFGIVSDRRKASTSGKPSTNMSIRGVV